MYQGKHQNRKSRRRWNKSFFVLVSLILLAGIAISGTIAFLTQTSDEVVNTFTPSKVTTEVTEDLSGSTKSNVKIQNTGDTEAYIRAAVVVTWQNTDGEVYGTAPVKGTDYTIGMGSDWVEGSDGFWYWPSPVVPQTEDAEKCFTGVLIESCTYLDNAPDGYKLNVEIIGSGIQSKPVDVVQNEWGVTVGGTTIIK